MLTRCHLAHALLVIGLALPAQPIKTDADPLPAHCGVIGSTLWRTSPSVRLYVCAATNTWTHVPDPDELLDYGILAHFLFGEDWPMSYLANGRCAVCKRLGWRSTVEMGGGTNCTAMFCGTGFYSEDGVYVPPPSCKTCSTWGACSKRHLIRQTFKSASQTGSGTSHFLGFSDGRWGNVGSVRALPEADLSVPLARKYVDSK